MSGREDLPPPGAPESDDSEHGEVLKRVLEGHAIGLWEWDLTTGHVRRSEPWATMLGYTLDEVENSLESWQDLLHPDDREATLRSNEEFIAGRMSSIRTEYRLRAKDGSYRWIQDLVAVVERDAGGRPLRAVGTHLDITARRESEEAERESERKYRSLFETSRDALMILAPPDWRFVEGNPATLEIFRVRDREQFTSLHPWQLSPQRQRDGRRSIDAAREAIERALAQGGHRFEWLHQRLDGERFEAVVLLTPFDWKGQRLLQASVRDLSERRRTEREYRTILETAIDGFWIADTSGRLLEVNDAACEMLGYLRDELEGMPIAEIEASETSSEIRRHIAQVHASGYDRFESKHRRKDGKVIDVEVSARVLPLRGGVIAAFIQDISARKQLELSRIEAGARLEALVSERTQSLARANRDLRQSRLAALNMMQDAVDARSRLEQANTELLREVGERERAEKEKAAAEQQLMQSQRIEAIGRLAGGIAHDFNNLLGVITGYGQLSLDELPARHAARTGLEQIMAAADRASHLTRQLLAFSRKQVMRTRSVDLNAVVTELEAMLKPLLGEDIELAVRLAPDLHPVRVDPAQLQQVVMNLAINAREAMPRGGRLTISTANVGPRLDSEAGRSEAAARELVELTVEDNGEGMDEETRRRCFEPFFTTKGEGEGTGLGLAMAYGIVKQSGGSIDVESEPGRGTTFRAYLPKAEGSDEVAVEERRKRADARGSETVLVVEDMEPLRRIIERILGKAGYVVLSAPNGSEALDIAGRPGIQIDLLLTDIVMPKLDGVELGRRIGELHPGTRILYMSGYTQGAISKQGDLAGGITLLDKPFTNDALTEAVRRALDRPAPT